MTMSPTNRRRRLVLRPLLALGAFALAMTILWTIPFRSRVATAWALAMAAYAAVLLRVIVRTRRERMMTEAHLHAAHSWIPDVVAGLFSIASIVMLISLAGQPTTESPAMRTAHVFISLVGVVLTWMVMNGIFALRYAAIYYAPAQGSERPRGGLRFPDEDLVPDYWDFLYYAFTIGMCYQTSDISLTSPEMRRQTLLHGVFAFLYVCGILSMLFGIVGGTL